MRQGRNNGYPGASSFRNGYRQPIVPTCEGDAIFQIDEVLARWGFILNRSIRDRSFVKSIKDATADCFARRLLKNWQPINLSVSLPKDLDEAMRLLLKHTIKQITKNGAKTTVIKTIDALKEGYDANLAFPPFNPFRGGYKMSRAYQKLGVSEEELHPLKRFSYEERSIGGYVFDEFSTEPGEEYPSHYIRALCTYETVHGNTTCVGCEARGSLAFNSSLRTDFCHIVCNGCGSVYTLSSVASSAKVQNLFDKKAQFRGSYAHYHEVRHYIKTTKAPCGSSRKMFFMFVTRSSQDGYDRQLPVYVAEIKGAAPNLNTDSFYEDRIRIKSNVVFEPLLNRRPWFTVTVPRDMDVYALSMEVFNDYFGTARNSKKQDSS